MEPLRIELVDAYQMHLESPDTFNYPSTDEINNIVIGDKVKVSNGKERFWNIIVEKYDNYLIGEINNHLIDNQNYDCGNKIIIEPRHIYQIRTIKEAEDIEDDFNNFLANPRGHVPRFYETFVLIQMYLDNNKKN